MNTIPLFQMYWDQQDINNVISSIEKGMNWAIDENIVEFESKIAEYIGTEFCTTSIQGPPLCTRSFI